MRKILLFIMLLLTILILPSCSCRKNKFKTVEEIKETYKYYDIVLDFNGSSFNLVKSSTGNYLCNESQEIYHYYNAIDNKTYRLNHLTNKKIAINSEDYFDTYIENVYYVLTYHTNINAKKFESTDVTFLDRACTKYYLNKDNTEQTYIVDQETGACFYILVKSESKSIEYKVLSLTVGDTDISKYNNYTTLSTLLQSSLKTKEEVIANLNSYDITLKLNESIIRIIKSEQGYYYQNGTSIGLLYNKSEDMWYGVNQEQAIKSAYKNEISFDDIESLLIELVTSYIESVNEYFYEYSTSSILDKEVICFESMSGDEKYYVDKSTGICLMSTIKTTTDKSNYEILNWKTTPSIDQFINYETVTGEVIYNSWPTKHEFLRGIEPISYGTFKSCVDGEDGLMLTYDDITQNEAGLIIEKFKQHGYNIFIDEEKEILDSTLIYWMYQLKNENNVTFTVEYYGGYKSLVITLK